MKQRSRPGVVALAMGVLGAVTGLGACAPLAPAATPREAAPAAIAAPPQTMPRLAASTAPRGFGPALRLAMPVVVSVYGIGASSTDLEPMFDSPGTRGDERAPWSTAATPANLGSGFFLDGQGLIVTAAHVVAQARQVVVKMADQRVVQADRVGLDPDLDIALLRVPLGPGVEPVFGRSAASRPGDWVLAVGEPYGLPRSVSAGIVGGLSRHFAEDGESLYIQSDLALNPGNSGGPLLDSTGAIIGMNLRTVVGPYGAGGVSLSIPIEVVRQMADELQDGHRRPPRPRLGASFEDVSALAAIDAGRAYASGALLTAISHNGAAARLGLRAGDIVVALNGHAVGDSGDLARLLFTWRSLPGTRVVVWRERRYLELVGV